MVEKEKCEGHTMRLGGVLTVGPKGQIVIPKDIRDEVGIAPGDSVAVLVKNGKFIGIVKNEDIGEIMEYINTERN